MANQLKISHSTVFLQFSVVFLWYLINICQVPKTNTKIQILYSVFQPPSVSTVKSGQFVVDLMVMNHCSDWTPHRTVGLKRTAREWFIYFGKVKCRLLALSDVI